MGFPLVPFFVFTLIEMHKSSTNVGGQVISSNKVADYNWTDCNKLSPKVKFA